MEGLLGIEHEELWREDGSNQVAPGFPWIIPHKYEPGGFPPAPTSYFLHIYWLKSQFTVILLLGT